MDTEKMGRFIAERRKDKHMTQKDFARMLNITDKAVSKWERGISCPDISLLPSVADILGVTIHELLNGEQSNTEAEGPAAGRENALQYADSEAEAAAGTMRSRCTVAFSLLLLAGSAACAVINTAVSGKLTWAPFPIVSMAFAWLVFFPVLKAGKKGLFGALLALSVFILPFLYVLSRLLKSNGTILAAGVPTAALSVVFLWSVFALFKRSKTRKRLAAAAALLLAVPICLLINLVLSKLFFVPVIDVWDMLAIFLLLISAAALFIADLAAKKKHIVSEKKPEHSGSRGHA